MIALLALFACGEPPFDPIPAIEETGYLDATRISTTRPTDADPLWIVGEAGAAAPGEVTAVGLEDVELDRVTVGDGETFVLEVAAARDDTIEVRQGEAEPVIFVVLTLPAFPATESLDAHTPDAEGTVAIDVVLLTADPAARLVATVPGQGLVATLESSDGRHFMGHISSSSGDAVYVHAVLEGGSTASRIVVVP